MVQAAVCDGRGWHGCKRPANFAWPCAQGPALRVMLQHADLHAWIAACAQGAFQICAIVAAFSICGWPGRFLENAKTFSAGFHVALCALRYGNARLLGVSASAGSRRRYGGAERECEHGNRVPGWGLGEAGWPDRPAARKAYRKLENINNYLRGILLCMPENDAKPIRQAACKVGRFVWHTS